MPDYRRGAIVRDVGELSRGDTVYLRPNFGAGMPVVAVIVGVHADLKNGRAGVDYHKVDAPAADLHWAYLDQVDCRAVETPAIPRI